jgi:hypothetical protein
MNVMALFFFFFDMSTRREGEFELVTFILLDVILSN